MRLIVVACVVASLAGCEGLATSGITFDPNRTYTTPQIVLPQQQSTQPNFQPFGNQQGQYQAVAFNTPAGIVYKQCKILNQKIVHCL